MVWIDAVHELDLSLLRSARAIPSWAVSVFYMFTVIGAGWGVLALVPFAIRRASRRTTLWLFGALAATSAAVQIVKWWIGRVRPCDALEWCSPLRGGSPGGWSFPSGHAAGSFAFAVFLTLRAPAFAPLLLLYAAAVAWSRCVLGVHYPTDVLAGSALGAAIGASFGLALRRRERPVPVETGS